MGDGCDEWSLLCYAKTHPTIVTPLGRSNGRTGGVYIANPHLTAPIVPFYYYTTYGVPFIKNHFTHSPTEIPFGEAEAAARTSRMAGARAACLPFILLL